MVTLQSYISRELLKTFALTATGLTILFSLGGGVLNMIQVDVLTAVQLGQILGFIVPVSVTLTLPVAALFSAAMVYGRLSSDNEFDACRSSGINVLWLLAPAVGLALAVFAFTFTFVNFVIPRFAEGLEQIVRSDPQRIVSQTLRTRGYLQYTGKYVIYADEFLQHEVKAPAGNSEYIELKGAAFIEMDQDVLLRYGTSPQVLVAFRDDPVTGDPLVEAQMRNVRLYDQEQRKFYQMGDQSLGPFAIPWKFRRKVKWMTLPELLHYREQPWLLPEVQEKMPGLRKEIQQFLFYEDVTARLSGGGRMCRLGDDRRGYEIEATVIPGDADRGLRLGGPVVVRQWWDGLRRTFRAGSGVLVVERPLTEEIPQVYLKLSDEVRFFDEGAQPRKEVLRSSVGLDPVPMPDAVVKKAASLSEGDLLDFRKPLGLSERIDQKRESLAGGLQGLARKVVVEMHARAAFSASVVVLLILGAALGIIFRGGEMLVAFVISFLPGLFVTVMIIMGRQMAEKTATVTTGLAIIWASLVLVAIADGVVLGRYLRR